MNKKLICCTLAVLSSICFTAVADENVVVSDNVTVDLSGAGVTADTEIAGAGSTAGNTGLLESAPEQAELLEIEDGEVLENYAMYDFSQYVPVKYEPSNDKEAEISNRTNSMTLAKVSTTLHTRSDVRGQDKGFGLNEYAISLKAPLLYKGQHKLVLNLDYSVFDFDTKMRLNNLDHNKYGYSALGAELPDMQSLAFMINYRYEIKNTDFAGGFFNDATVGTDFIVDSKSDKLFNSIDETNVTSLLNFRMPIFENQAITIMGGYMSDFKMPIAGIGYQLNFGKASYLNIGFPLNNIHINSADVFCIETDRFNFDFNWIAFGDLSTRLSYDIVRGKVQVFGNFEWNTDTWARADREDKRSRVFYTDYHLGGGLRVDFFKHFYAQAEAGWAFGRNVYEERNFYDYNKGFDIDDSAYLKLEAGIVF